MHTLTHTHTQTHKLICSCSIEPFPPRSHHIPLLHLHSSTPCFCPAPHGNSPPPPWIVHFYFAQKIVAAFSSSRVPQMKLSVIIFDFFHSPCLSQQNYFQLPKQPIRPPRTQTSPYVQISQSVWRILSRGAILNQLGFCVFVCLFTQLHGKIKIHLSSCPSLPPRWQQKGCQRQLVWVQL